ncbi:ScpA family protein [Arthrobacter sp. APC 3897]|uniref:segregation and condensation protein A n=1 Tax=Arthrobacter sp. APC 3897 TaxID=3035204 RepID=UPI0025B5B837|nr:ScpA family protein [Arthrobacter sp. APC 3897]MDN3481720.1 ScpA family protein [Arthrobacter sp. APC 3897]
MTGSAESAAKDTESPPVRGFRVRLENFTGPFDVLLSLISKRELDITEVALADVTDDFIGYIKALGDAEQAWALDEASEFLVIAATLLDLKAARLLPAGDVEDAEDVALLEARDLLFARLLQYRAFKQIAGILDARLQDEAERFPRRTGLEPRFAAMLPELIWRTGPQDFAAMAARALAPQAAKPATVGLAHLHAPKVSVREQAAIIARRLKTEGRLSFAALVDDAGSSVAVARFLALLELFRDGAVSFDQTDPLGELLISWCAAPGACPAARNTGSSLANIDSHHAHSLEEHAAGPRGAA